MDIKQLTYFNAIAEEGSISAAARRLHISQPPLSTQMRLLEAELGCVLFERGARHICLTEAGQLLYACARTLLTLADSTKRELQDYQEGTQGTLRLGVVSSISGTMLQQWLVTFHESHPQVRFNIAEANTYQLQDLLVSGSIELAIIRTPFSENGLKYHFLPAEPMLAAGHPSFFSSLSQDTLSLAHLSQFPLLIYHRWERVLTDLFSKAHLEPYILCNNEDARTTLLLAQGGLGVGVVPHSARSLDHDASLVFKTIESQALASRIAVAWSSSGYLSALAHHFIQHVLRFF